MTREEAKSCIGTIEMLQRLAYNIHGVMDVIDADNCEKIIKALEQEPILDKIRAEIEQEIIPRNSGQYDHEAKWQNCGLRIALKVIDEYKAESEPQESDIDKRKPCINYADGCEEWAGCPCVYYKPESEEEE